MTRETALAQFRLLFGHLQQFHGVGGFLLPVHPLFSLPLWAPPKALSKLGNIRNGDISRKIPVIAQELPSIVYLRFGSISLSALFQI